MLIEFDSREKIYVTLAQLFVDLRPEELKRARVLGVKPLAPSSRGLEIARVLARKKLVPPPFKILLASGAAHDYARLRDPKWISLSLVLVSDKLEKSLKEFWEPHIRTYSKYFLNPIAFVNLAFEPVEKKVVVMELQNELNTRTVTGMREKESFKKKYGPALLNWHKTLLIAAKLFADEKNASFFVSTPEHHMARWGHLEFSPKAAKNIYRVTTESVRRLLGLKHEYVPVEEVLEPISRSYYYDSRLQKLFKP